MYLYRRSYQISTTEYQPETWYSLYPRQQLTVLGPDNMYIVQFTIEGRNLFSKNWRETFIFEELGDNGGQNILKQQVFSTKIFQAYWENKWQGKISLKSFDLQFQPIDETWLKFLRHF